jgi:hypothetical protein
VERKRGIRLIKEFYPNIPNWRETGRNTSKRMERRKTQNGRG